MSLTRRNFLLSCLPNQIQKLTTVSKSNSDTSSFYLGNMSDFEVGTINVFSINGEDFSLHSKEVGLSLMSKKTNKYFELILKNNGEIYTNLSNEWPSSSVLSLLTGEIYNL